MKTILKNENEIAVVMTKEELQTLKAACVGARLYYRKNENETEYLKKLMEKHYHEMEKTLEQI